MDRLLVLHCSQGCESLLSGLRVPAGVTPSCSPGRVPGLPECRQCSVGNPVPSHVLNLLKAAHAMRPTGESWGDPVRCRDLAGSLGVMKGDHAQVPCGVRDTWVPGQVGRVGFQQGCQPSCIRGSPWCRPSTRWGLLLPIRHIPHPGAAWALEDRRPWGSADCLGHPPGPLPAVSLSPGSRALSQDLAAPPPASQSPSGLTPLRTRTSLLPHGCQPHPCPVTAPEV